MSDHQGDLRHATTAFTLNRIPVASGGDRQARLLYVLRNEFGRTGTRFGCGMGLCGSCMVLVDGHPVPSCDTPLWSIEGKDIRTVEDDGPVFALLRQCFARANAVQCGYCASGILVSAAALLSRTTRPAEAEVRAVLDRHLCRCGAHNRIVAAILAAAGQLHPEPGTPDPDVPGCHDTGPQCP